MTSNHNPLRVGYVVKMFPRLSETFILNEMLELERRGVEVVVFSAKKPNEGKFHPQVSELKARVFYLDDLDVKKWPSWLGAEWPGLAAHRDRLFELLEETISADRSWQVDHVWWAAWIAAQAQKLGLSRLHAHFATLPSTMAYLAHRVSEIPFSFTAHAKDIFVYTMEEHGLREKLAAASFVVTVTNFNRRYLLENAPEIDPDKIKVLHNGVDLNRFKPDASIRRDGDLILGVGRLVPKKGFKDLLDACHILKENGVSFRCLIAGMGPEESALHEQRSALGLESEVTLAGPKNLDEVLDLMQKAAVFCLPCTVASDNNVDALPTVLLEALGCGLPIVSTTVSGVPEIVDTGVDGYLVSPDDPAALSRRLSELLSSADRGRAFALAGREKALQKFDLRTNVASLLRWYETVDSRPATTPPLTDSTAASRNRVLYVCADRGIPFGGTKGAAIHVGEFLKALQADGCEPTAVVARYDSRNIDAPYSVHRFPQNPMQPFFDAARDQGKSVTTIAEVREFSQNMGVEHLLGQIDHESGFDFVYERYSLFGLAGCALARRLGLPFVLEVNAPLVEEAARYRELAQTDLVRAIEMYLFSEADQIVTVSAVLKQYVQGIAPQACVTVVPNGVDPERFNLETPDQRWRDRLTARPADDFVVGFVGRVRPWHGVAELIDAVGLVAAHDKSVTLCVVGETGEDQDKLDRQCAEVGLDGRATFTGAVAPEFIPNILQSMDVLVAPYPELADFYFSPLKVFEYMAAGRPIVASAIGQVQEVLSDGRTALLVPPGDAKALAAALECLRADGALGKKLARNAMLEAQQKHTWRQRVQTVRALVRSQVSSSRTQVIHNADTL